MSNPKFASDVKITSIISASAFSYMTRRKT